jgi:hypothetical protein
VSKKPEKPAAKAPPAAESAADLVPTFLSIELPLPLGIGLTDENVISEINPQASSAMWQLGDRLIWADGREVRGGAMAVGQAIDPERHVHEFVLQRLTPPSTKEVTFMVRLTPEPGGLGIGLSKTNAITDLSPDKPAAKDGRLEVHAAPPRRRSPASAR